jgi:hypothetical protein
LLGGGIATLRRPRVKLLLKTLAPTATNLIRIDPMQRLAAFRQDEAETRPKTKKGLVHTVSLALEIHV